MLNAAFLYSISLLIQNNIKIPSTVLEKGTFLYEKLNSVLNFFFPPNVNLINVISENGPENSLLPLTSQALIT